MASQICVLRKDFTRTFVCSGHFVDDLLKELHNASQMAILLDEYGGMSGLVTLEGLLEEIVGEVTMRLTKQKLSLKLRTILCRRKAAVTK